jgi:hypothetical protein
MDSIRGVGSLGVSTGWRDLDFELRGDMRDMPFGLWIASIVGVNPKLSIRPSR